MKAQSSIEIGLAGLGAVAMAVFEFIGMYWWTAAIVIVVSITVLCGWRMCMHLR